MEYPLIDFDRYFSDYINEWVVSHKQDYHNLEEMEDDMPNIYRRFLSAPAQWLDGGIPGEYFAQYEDASSLCEWMCEYNKADIGAPEQLLNRITELGNEAVAPLMRILKDSTCSKLDKMTAVGLLRELDSAEPMELYVSWQVKRKQDDELADNALESLNNMGMRAVEALRAAFDSANAAGREAMLDILCRYPGDDRVYNETIKLFRNVKERRAIFAGYLARLMDERALPALMKAAKEDDLPYLDFIEIRNAIEVLGGDPPLREYDEDEGYAAMRAIEDSKYKEEN